MKERPSGLDWTAVKAPKPEDPKPKRRGRVKIDLTPKEIAEAVNDYAGGATAPDVAFTYGVSYQTVLKWVRAAGGRVRSSDESTQLDREKRIDS